VAHVTAWETAGSCAVSAVAIIVGLVLAIAVHPLVGLVVGVGGPTLAVLSSNKKKEQAKSMCSPQCTSASRAVSFLGWSGTVQTFEIASERYALAFMHSNHSKLVNVSPEMRAKMAGVSSQPSTAMPIVNLAPAPLPPIAKDNSDDALLKWIDKVESARGPAARRAAVEFALNDPELFSRRDQFIKTAAQVEVRATLDKVESLKTPAAKRRHLTDALTALHGDSAPDEMQRAEIECLEAAIRELDAR
jgi:hypothetical protein